VAIVTLEDVREYADLGDTISEGRLQVIIDGVIARAERYCQRTFAAGTHTEYHRGGRDYITVRCPPWTSITTLEDGHPDAVRAISVASNVRSESDLKDAGEVRLWNGESEFTAGEESVKIIYAGGFEPTTNPTPADLKQALMEQAMLEYDHAARIGMASVGGDGANVTYRAHSSGFAAEVRAVLDGYRLWHRSVSG
jgi:hypothetical protein